MATKWVRVAERGEASREAVIRLLQRIAPLSFADAAEAADRELAFPIDDALSVMRELEAMGSSGLRLEDAPPRTRANAALDPSLCPRVNVRYAGGPRKISAIKLARSLLTPRPGLKEIKELIERGDIIAQAIPLDEARALELRFAELESQLHFEPLPSYDYALDPRDPARGDQVFERLRSQGHDLIHERGQLAQLAWTPLARHRVETLDAREQLRDAQRQQWQRDGMRVFETGLDALAASSPRNLELEAGVRAEREAGPALIVHADWLQSAGDPRGELAAAQLAGDSARSSTLLETHASHLFGPLYPELEARVQLRWMPGFVEHAHIQVPRFTAQWGPGLSFAATLLAQPCFACLRSLHLSGTLRDYDLSELLRQPALASLRELRVDGQWWQPSQIHDWSELPSLERLQLEGVAFDDTPLELPRLHTLELRVARFAVDPHVLLKDARTPRLRTLSIQTLDPATASRDVSALAATLAQPALDGLRNLTLFPDDLEELEAFVETVASAPFAPALERIELHAPGHIVLPDALPSRFGPRLHLISRA